MTKASSCPLLGTAHSECTLKVAAHPEAPSLLPVLCVPSCSLSSEVEVTVCHPTAIPLQLWACGSALRLAFIPHLLTALPLCLHLSAHLPLCPRYARLEIFSRTSCIAYFHCCCGQIPNEDHIKGERRRNTLREEGCVWWLTVQGDKVQHSKEGLATVVWGAVGQNVFTVRNQRADREWGSVTKCEGPLLVTSFSL